MTTHILHFLLKNLTTCLPKRPKKNFYILENFYKSLLFLIGYLWITCQFF